MSKPYEVERAFRELEPNLELLEAIKKQTQKAYLRRRMRAIQLLWEGKSRTYVLEVCDVTYKTLVSWIKVLVAEGVEAGLRRLGREKQVKQPSKLSPAQQEALLAVLTNEAPSAYGYEQNIFTAQMLVEIVKSKWNIDLSDQTIYNLLRKHRFSYQRAHRDYGTPDPAQQQAFQATLKKNGKRPTSGKGGVL